MCLSFLIINLYLAFLVIIIRYVVDVSPDLQLANLQDKMNYAKINSRREILQQNVNKMGSNY